MVLFKRKPITHVEPPPNLDSNAEVWVMRGSNEVFTSYDSYLERYDFYSQRHFTDAVNGKSGMNYFEALESETTSTSDIERTFPEALRAPILRRVQFSEVGRMNDLVDIVFAEFKNDFFPGEELSVVLDNGEAMDCMIREKANFPELRNPDGSVQRPAFSRYFVKIKDTQESALLEDGYLKRGRNVFTKQNVRSFLKNALQREAWIGAPWLVKEPLAQQYRLPMTIPPHLTQEAKAAQMRHLQMAQREAQREAEQAAARKGKKGKGGKMSGIDLLLQADIEAQLKQEEEKPRIPQYPCEDLDVPQKPDLQARPTLKYLAPLDGSPNTETGLRIQSTGSLLEIWNALTVHWDTYQLEPFTFDDFFDAMRFSSPSVSCDLADEIHCAVMKLLIGKEKDIDVFLAESFPSADSELSSSTDETPDDSEPATPIEPTPRSRKSRLSEVQTINDHPTSNGHANHKHQAADVLENADWPSRIARQDFGEGGWQVILVGILEQLSHSRIWSSKTLPILSYLAPYDLPATRETVLSQYMTLDLNHRITALEILITLSFCTTVMRTSFDTRSEEMTSIRKQKVETQRLRKEHLRELQRLELDRRENNPDAFIDEDEDTKKEEADTPMLSNGHPTLDDSLSTNGAHSDPDNDDEEAPSRPMRRTHNARKRKRDEEAAKKESERLERLSKQKDAADKVKKYKRILRDIDTAKKRVTDCEIMIEEFDERLRAINSARMKSLGRDRFWGRWWWFERIGMAVDGRRPLQSGSGRKAHLELVGEGYANGRLWIQGPLDVERKGFIDIETDEQEIYTARHGMSIHDRQKAEAGSETVNTAEQWGYYDTIEDLDALIAWLDDRGKREKDLKKELLLWREDIQTQFSALHQTLYPSDPTDTASPEAEESKGAGPRTRVSTRTKTYLDEDDVSKRWRCLKWRNSQAATKSGRHCEAANPPPPPRPPPAIKIRPPRGEVVPGAQFKPGSHKKGAAAAFRAEKEKEAAVAASAAPPAPEEVVAPVEEKVASRGRAASGRLSGTGGKGVAIKVNGASKKKKKVAAEEVEVEEEMPVANGGRETRGAGGRKKRVFYGDEDEGDARTEGVRTRRSARVSR